MIYINFNFKTINQLREVYNNKNVFFIYLEKKKKKNFNMKKAAPNCEKKLINNKLIFITDFAIKKLKNQCNFNVKQ